MEDSPRGGTRVTGAGWWWRVSLRAKGAAVLAVPMAALFAAFFSIYMVEGDVRGADQTVVRAYNTRSQLVELHSSLLDGQTAALMGGDAKGVTQLETIRRLTAEEVRLLDELREQRPRRETAGPLMER